MDLATVIMIVLALAFGVLGAGQGTLGKGGVLTGAVDVVGILTKAVTARARRMLTGRVFFAVPRLMWKDYPERVELRLAPRAALNDAERRAIMQSFGAQDGAVEDGGEIRIGSRMAAQLNADPEFFHVEALSSQEQDFDLASRHALRWDWRVKPLRTGRSKIRIRLTVKNDVHGEAFEVDTDPYEREVDVRIQSVGVEVRRFWRDHWKWVLTTSGGLGAAGVAWGAVAGLFGVNN